MSGTSVAPEDVAGGVTLDSLFRAAVASRPQTIALIDPPNRSSFTDGASRRLTYAEADAQVERLARRLCSFGLPASSVVAVQLPNIREAVISLLAILRAGLIAAPVPMLWRRSDLVAALAGVAPKALITLARLDGERPAEVVCEAAAELFHLSFPCSFGSDIPDGLIALDRDDDDLGALVEIRSHAGAPCLVTFDAVADGFYAAGRNDAQWLAAGIATLLEAGIESGDTIVSTLAPNSLAGIGTGFVPWLLSGGTLQLVHGTALPVNGGLGEDDRTHLVAPAAAFPEIARARSDPFASCIAVHRGPGTVTRNFSDLPVARVVDLLAFGESGLLTLSRENRRQALPIPLGPVSAPSGGGAPVILETRLDRGELIVRGPMVPRMPFPDSLSSPRLPLDANGFVRTGYRCHCDGKGTAIIDAGPDRVASIGGLRFGLDDLQRRLAKAFSGIKVEAVGDPLLGERLRIEADDPSAAAAALQAAGHSLLVVNAVARSFVNNRAVG